jgi:Bacterial SH3 domain
MTSVDLTNVRPNNEESFVEDRLGPPAELWAPPLAPIGDEDAFLPPEQSNLSETFGSRRQLIAGTAIVAALGVAVLTYFFLASPGTNAPAETSPIVSSLTGAESSSETWVQPAPTVALSSPEASVPASLTDEASSQVAASAMTPQSTSMAQSPELLFLQRPGVNIRSAPSGNATVLGTAPKGTQFTATGREGDWVQVENTRLKGWINSQFLAPDKPR